LRWKDLRSCRQPASGGRQSPDQLAAERTCQISFVARCPCPNGFPCCGAIRGLTSSAVNIPWTTTSRVAPPQPLIVLHKFFKSPTHPANRHRQVPGCASDSTAPSDYRWRAISVTFVRVSSPKHGDAHWRFPPRHLTVPVLRVASTGVARDSAGGVGTVGQCSYVVR
jgi:hypothetical protein